MAPVFSFANRPTSSDSFYIAFVIPHNTNVPGSTEPLHQLDHAVKAADKSKDSSYSPEANWLASYPRSPKAL